MYIIQTLAQILRGGINTAEQRESICTLSAGHFGGMVINPLRVDIPDTGYRNESGSETIMMILEGDETRGGSKGRRHRIVMTLKHGVRLPIFCAAYST